MRHSPRLRPAAMASALVCALASSGGCAGTQAHPCNRDTWTGSCFQRGTQPLREVEFPVPYTVYQVIFSPRQDFGASFFAPPDASLEYQVMSGDEEAFTAYLAQYRTAQCRLGYEASTECTPGRLEIAIPPFDARLYRAAASADAPQGCRRIEAQGTGAGPDLGHSEKLGAPLHFATGTDALDATGIEALDAAARTLLGDPSIECVGLVGQIASGEPLGLAEQRARAVKRLLVERGVAESRLMTVTATVPVYSGPERPVADPAEQRVHMTIILRSGAAAAP